MIVSPNLLWGQLVVLVAPVSLWLQRRELAPEASRDTVQGRPGNTVEGHVQPDS